MQFSSFTAEGGGKVAGFGCVTANDVFTQFWYCNVNFIYTTWRELWENSYKKEWNLNVDDLVTLRVISWLDTDILINYWPVDLNSCTISLIRGAFDHW